MTLEQIALSALAGAFGGAGAYGLPEWLASKRHREALAVIKARIEQMESK